LTSSICARHYQLGSALSPYMADDADRSKDFSLSPFPKTYIFHIKNIIRLTHTTNGSPDFSFVKKHCSPKRSVRKLLSLLSRIYRLFAVESDGLFRLKKNFPCRVDCKDSEYYTEGSTTDLSTNHMERDLFSRIDNDISMCPSSEYNRHKENMSLALFKPPCSLYQCVCSGINYGDYLNCGLCRTPDEAIVQSKQISDEINGSKHGVGCAIISDLCLSNHKNPFRKQLLNSTKAFTPVQGELDAIKILLLKVAANVPSTLFPSSSKSFNKLSIPLLRHQIWNEENMKIWIQFVNQCINSRMIAQAYVILLCSINKKRMPAW